MGEVIVALCFIAFSYGAIEKGGPMIQAMFDEKIGGIQESLGAQTKAEMNVLGAEGGDHRAGGVQGRPRGAAGGVAAAGRDAARHFDARGAWAHYQDVRHACR